MDGLRPVRPGERVVFSADAHNAMVEAARAHRDRQGKGRQGIGGDVPAGTVLVRNTTGSTVPRFGVLGISGVTIPPSSGEASFFVEPCFEGVSPSASTPNWVVVQEPIAAGAIGRAIVSGMTVARVTVASGEEDFRYVEIAAGTTDHLVPVESGQGEILYREPGTGSKRALVRMSNTPSTGAGQTFLAIVKAPSSNGAISSSYTVDIYGTTIASLSEAPTIEDEVALQSPAELRFWRSEIVGVVRSGDTWLITKFLTLPVAFTVSAGQVALRVGRIGVDDSTTPTNFLLDLHACLDTYQGGAVVGPLYATFSYGTFYGVGRMSIDVVVPVKKGVGWNLATLDVTEDTFAAAFPQIVSNTPPRQVSTSQDAVPESPAAFSEVTSVDGVVTGWTRTRFYAAETYFYSSAIGNRELEEMQAIVLVHVDIDPATAPSEFVDEFSTMPALPAIAGAVDSTRILLVGVEVRFFPNSDPTAVAPNKFEPTLRTFESVPIGGQSLTNTYGVDTSPGGFTTVAVLGT